MILFKEFFRDCFLGIIAIPFIFLLMIVLVFVCFAIMLGDIGHSIRPFIFKKRDEDAIR